MTEDLEFERDRAVELRNEINRLTLELEGPGIDEQVFAKMAPQDVELVRAVVQDGPLVERDDVDQDWIDFGNEETPEDVADQVDYKQLEAEYRAEQEAEIVRLQEEIVVSERRQQALEAYLEALATLG